MASNEADIPSIDGVWLNGHGKGAMPSKRPLPEQYILDVIDMLTNITTLYTYTEFYFHY